MRFYPVALLSAVLVLISVQHAHAGFFVVDDGGALYFTSDADVLGRDDDRDDNSDSGSSGSSENSNSNDDDFSGSSDRNSSGPGSADEQRERVEIRTQDSRIRTETRTKNGQTETKSEVRTPQERIKIEARDGRLRLEQRGPDEDENIDFADEMATRSADRIQIEEHRDRQRVDIRARDARLEFERRGVSAVTQFPLSIGDENELIVTTPAGTRVVAVLPDEAVANLLERNIIDRVSARFAGGTATSSARRAEPATEAAAPAGGEMEDIELLTTVDGAAAFRIRGVKNVRLLGLFPTEAAVTTVVSAETGELLQVQRPLFLRLLPFLFTD